MHRRSSSRVLRSAALLAIASVAVTVAGAATEPRARETAQKLPWAAAGLSEREAAAHLLDRFAFGPRPGEVDRVVAMGLEAWLEAQLAGTVAETVYPEKVRSLDAWRLPASEITRAFPPPVVVRREAMRAGVVDRTMMEAPDAGKPPADAKDTERRRALFEFSREQGYRPQSELVGQLMAHKLLQAVYSESQLEAVLVDFWFNHFNVSLQDNQARGYLLSFERDAIAPGVLGKFGDLLAKVAAHPAMLFYLDNAQSTANPGAATTLDRRMTAAGFTGARGGDRTRPARAARAGAGRFAPMDAEDGAMERGGRGAAPSPADVERPARPRGLNENYARELLELHTLGVDGGYTQDDVIAVARAFTGWTVLPPGELGDRARERMRRIGGGGRLGFIERDGGFLFRADAHDAEAKTVLGTKLPAGRGIEDGTDVLALLARHPSTARHLATKIAARFVADEPPPALVDRLARTFLESDGDLRVVMRTLAYSPEFWSRDARGAKIKSPFELAVSAVRALGAEVAVAAPVAGPMAPERRRAAGPPGLIDWIARMGQPLYAYQAPTGYPDRAEAWVSTGSLLTRMNFGLHLATGRVRGAVLDLPALNGNREPESPEHALATYASLILPERDLAATVERLQPMIRDPQLGGRLEQAAAEQVVDAASGAGAAAGDMTGASDDAEAPSTGDTLGATAPIDATSPAGASSPTPLENVVGLILGSPEFQRR